MWEYDENEHTLKSNGKCLTIYMNEESKEIWAGRLSDDSFAVLFLNRGSLSNELEIKWTEIGFYNHDAKIRDLWERRDLGIFKDGYKITLNPHTSKLFKITPSIEIPQNEINKEESNVKSYVIAIVCLSIIIVLLLIVIFILIKKLREKSSNNIDNEVNKMNINLVND